MPRTPAVLVAVTGAFLAAACGQHDTPPTGTDARRPAIVVRTVAAAALGDTASAVPGVVQARRRAALSARIPASVVALPFREGERVEAGQVVVRLDDTALRSALAAADAAAKTASTDLARLEALVKRQAATPRERDEASARAAGAEAAVQAARDQLTYAALAAPFAGRIAARPTNVGDVVAPGATLIEIEGDDGFEVQASLDSGEVPLRIGSRVSVQVDGLAAPAEAVVRSVSAAADPTTHRFDVRADLPSLPGLRSGLFARLLVPVSVSPDERPAISIPVSALVERGGLAGAFVVSDGQARLRWIAIGHRSDDRVEVRAGLAPGERVVLQPATLEDGAAVTEAAEAAAKGGR